MAPPSMARWAPPVSRPWEARPTASPRTAAAPTTCGPRRAGRWAGQVGEGGVEARAYGLMRIGHVWGLRWLIWPEEEDGEVSGVEGTQRGGIRPARPRRHSTPSWRSPPAASPTALTLD